MKRHLPHAQNMGSGAMPFNTLGYVKFENRLTERPQQAARGIEFNAA